MSFLHNLTFVLQRVAEFIPLEGFVVIGSIVEEIIAPIPSPFVMTLAGSLAHAKGVLPAYLFLLALLGSLGKTVASWIMYVVADKMEDVVVPRLGKYLGVTHAEIEHIGRRLKKGWIDYVIMFVIRALPIVPSAPISVVCGTIKLDRTTFLVSTFLGTIVRNMLFLYLGYSGLNSYTRLTNGLQEVESVVQIVIVVVILGVLAWAYAKRRRFTKAIHKTHTS